ncbi:MAG: hypothetical protein FWD15_01580 [Alphaproteobacteria bacterium]|nr:hypothetical protein [Alphaproteobacteria bacterium]
MGFENIVKNNITMDYILNNSDEVLDIMLRPQYNILMRGLQGKDKYEVQEAKERISEMDKKDAAIFMAYANMHKLFGTHDSFNEVLSRHYETKYKKDSYYKNSKTTFEDFLAVPDNKKMVLDILGKHVGEINIISLDYKNYSNEGRSGYSQASIDATLDAYKSFPTAKSMDVAQKLSIMKVEQPDMFKQLEQEVAKGLSAKDVAKIKAGDSSRG